MEFEDVMKKVKNGGSTYEREKIALNNEIVAPKVGILELTQKCPMNCRHCILKNKEQDELPASKWFEAIDKLHRGGVEKVILEGGEPTIHQDFDKILGYCINRFDSVSVQTSGYTRPNLNDYDINLTVSIEYANPKKNNGLRRITPEETHKYFEDRGVAVPKDKVAEFEELWGKLQEGKDVREKLSKLGVPEDSFQRAMDTLKKNQEIDRTIRTTIYNDNDILTIAALAERLGVNSVFVPLKPVGLGETLKGKTPSMKRLGNIIKEIMTFNKHSRMEHRVEETYWYLANREVWQRFKDVFAQRGKVCEGGHYRLFVNWKGEVTPCLMLPDTKMGNIYKQEIKNILREMYKWTQDAVELAHEKSCDRCFGGCLAEVYANQSQAENPCPFPIEDKEVK